LESTLPASRTPEGWPNRCHLCGQEVTIEPSTPPGDAPCPFCGCLLWFSQPTAIIPKPEPRRSEAVPVASTSAPQMPPDGLLLPAESVRGDDMSDRRFLVIEWSCCCIATAAVIGVLDGSLTFVGLWLVAAFIVSWILVPRIQIIGKRSYDLLHRNGSRDRSSGWIANIRWTLACCGVHRQLDSCAANSDNRQAFLRPAGSFLDRRCIWMGSRLWPGRHSPVCHGAAIVVRSEH
jgi:hypothetical protein